MNPLRFILISTILLAGCAGSATQGEPASARTPTSVANNAPVTVTMPAAATLTATPAPTASPTITVSPTPTSTITPTPHPMTIAALRAHSYPGSPITIEQELDAGPNYHRYYASYRSDGLKIYALLTVPFGDPPPGGWPAIVFNHGYIAPDVYRTTERYVNYVGDLARSGYIVFRIDYRGHDRSEGVATGAYGDRGYTIDVLNAVASIKQFLQANPQKIGMWGHSMGGFLTLRAMVISPDIKAGVIWSGVVGAYPDMLYNWRRTGPTPTQPPTARGWRTRWIEQYGTPEENPAFWNSVSANAYLGDLSGPLQLDASPADPEVPFAFSETLEKQVQAAGRVVELNSFPDNDHNLAQSFSVAMARTIKFYDQYLK
jgi:uncharacterized protein